MFYRVSHNSVVESCLGMRSFCCWDSNTLSLTSFCNKPLHLQVVHHRNRLWVRRSSSSPFWENLTMQVICCGCCCCWIRERHSHLLSTLSTGMETIWISTCPGPWTYLGYLTGIQPRVVAMGSAQGQLRIAVFTNTSHKWQPRAARQVVGMSG